MKKLGIGLFILFICIAGLYAVVQSNLGKDFIRNRLASALAQSGFEVQIGHIEGTLPHQIDLKEVLIQGKGLHIAVKELKVRPVLWRLLQKELAFTDVHAEDIVWDGSAPFNFDGTFRVSAKRAVVNGRVADWKVYGKFSRDRNAVAFNVGKDLFSAQGTVAFGKENFFHAVLDQPFGRVIADGTVVQEGAGYRGTMTWKIPRLALQGTGSGSWDNHRLKGEIGAGGLASAAVDVEVQGKLLSGTSQLKIENLQAFQIPNVFGSLDAKAKWEIADGIQAVHLDGTASQFYYDTFFAQKVSLYSDLTDPFKTVSGWVDVEIEKGKWHDLTVETASIETRDGAFKLFAEGAWKHPLEIHMNGTWKDALIVDIQEMNGTFFNHPFALERAVRFERTKEKFSLPDVEIGIAGGSAFVNIEDNRAEVRLTQMPLDILSLNPLDVPVSGTINLKASIAGNEGDLTASIEDMKVAGKMDAAGKFSGHFNRDVFDIKGNLLVGGKPLFDIDAKLPIQFSLYPFRAHLLTHKSAKGALSLEGRIEDVLDFFDLGSHRLEGKCKGAFRFSNTLSRPLVEGTLQIQNGFYENYYTGTTIHNISADFLAEKNKIYLRSLVAENGALKGDGDIHLLQADHYPFRLDAQFQNLKFAEIDLVSATANGQIHIEGNTVSALAKGDVQVVKTELSIPDHIPHAPPNLQVTYRNAIHPTAPPDTEYRPYPLFLDLNITTPENISIGGRGLNSEWKGNFHLGGTFTSLSTKGKLELVDGEFQFSGRSFKLTDGALTFSGIEHEMPSINLASSMETKGITIVARLKGPLDNPQITLQSTPPLPLGSIMSYLLFGQDVSDIGGFQALQIAASIASIAGTGPDVMESTRKSLGIDRLRVITDPTEEGGETVSIQVGKYVAEGVLVSFSQGTEESSTNISVEVELKNNFVFQIESDQHQEQGKFTLKWNLNY